MLYVILDIFIRWKKKPNQTFGQFSQHTTQLGQKKINTMGYFSQFPRHFSEFINWLVKLDYHPLSSL